MLAREAIRYAELALEEEVRHALGDAYLGAYVMGSLAAKDPDDEFDEHTSDIDLAVVVLDHAIDNRYPHGKFVVAGPCLVQIIYTAPVGKDRERLLTMLGLGSNLRNATILSDPDGVIDSARRLVAAEWARPEWVAARTERAIGFVEEAMSGLRAAEIPRDRIGALTDIVTQMGGLIAIANAATPTHRKSLILARRLLGERSGLVDAIVAAAGAGEATATETADAIADARAAVALDTAYPQPMFSPAAAALVPDHTAAGLIELVDLGYPGDALINAAGGVAISAMILEELGTEEDRAAVSTLVERRAASLGIDDGTWSERVERVEACIHDISTYCRRLTP